MQVRRWWQVLPVVLVSMLMAPTVGAAPAAAPGSATISPDSSPSTVASVLNAKAAQLAAAAPGEANDIRESVLSSVSGNPPAVFLQTFANAAVDAFEPLLQNNKPHVALNAVMILAQIKHIDTDRALVQALTNKNPAVRFWAAKGMADILPGLRQVPAFSRDVAAVAAALGKETSFPAAGAMAEALGASGDPSAVQPLVAFLDRLEKEFREEPDATVMDPTIDAVTAVGELGSAISQQNQTPAAAQKVVNLMSLAAQYLQNRVVNNPGTAEGHKSLVFNLGSAGVTALNRLGARPTLTWRVRINQDAAIICDEINTNAGSPSVKGRAQTSLQGVKQPPKAPGL